MWMAQDVSMIPTCAVDCIGSSTLAAFPNHQLSRFCTQNETWIPPACRLLLLLPFPLLCPLSSIITSIITTITTPLRFRDNSSFEAGHCISPIYPQQYNASPEAGLQHKQLVLTS